MKDTLEKLERLFAAISFAEAGEQGTARAMMEKTTRRAEIHELGAHREKTSSPSRPARRAA